jgi:hypothetical protein
MLGLPSPGETVAAAVNLQDATVRGGVPRRCRSCWSWSRARSTSRVPLVAPGIGKYVMKPSTVVRNLHDRELLAQIEAVDVFLDGMHA